MGFIGGLALAGVGLATVGQFKAGQDAAAAYKYNQELARYQSKYAQDKADIEVAALERDFKKFASRRRAVTGKSGTVVDSGSNLDSLLRSREEADLDAALIRYNANVASTGALNQANLFGAQADQVSQAGYIGAGSTLLGGLSRWDWRRRQISKRSVLATSTPIPVGGPI